MDTDIIIHSENDLKDKIYMIRSVQVMLDKDLAEIYGYATNRFNEQVKNNSEKFDEEDLMFQLTKEEFDALSRSRILTSKSDSNLMSKKSTSSWGGRRKPPRAFTESGLYMLMTVLRGELATKQSRALIRIFRAMKDYIVDTQGLATQRDFLRLSMQTTENTEAIKNVQTILMEHDDKLANALEQISDTVRKSEISPFLLDFSKPEEQKEYLFLNGQLAKADVTYIDIYSQAKKSIHIVDDYINIKTLYLLQDIKSGVSVTVFSDNNYNKLHACDYADFQREFPGISIDFIQTQSKIHDRFIVLDYDTDDERIFHCGGSSKDGGNKLMAITEFSDGKVKAGLHDEIKGMLSNPMLILV